VAQDAHRDLSQMLASHPETPSFCGTPVLRRLGGRPLRPEG
jgi:hypothetical protein